MAQLHGLVRESIQMNRITFWGVLTSLFIGTLFLLTGFSTLPAPARGEAVPPVLYRVVVYAPDRESRTALVRAGLVPEDVDLRSGMVTLVVDSAALSWLHSSGWYITESQPLDFPPADAGYHNYTEMAAELSRLASTYPDILQVSVYGKSVEGRDLYVVKISDNVVQDERDAEPGILLFANIHAREHLTLEQALWVIRHLVENYGQDPTVTNLVNQREIWVMPNTNPDGTEFDIARGFYRYWRKNRRRNADGTIGVDLNRNFSYKWGCCGGSSGTPASEIYRGPHPFSEPETVAIRDFFLAHPNIQVSLNFHSYSELVLWPYGYTYAEQPPDMNPKDHAIMVRAGRRMARMSGYTPMQASGLYVADGTSDDWVYGALRIPTWTVELYPPQSPPGFYPPDEVIPQETTRNRGMVEYVIGLADTPERILGTAGDLITPTVTLTVPTPLIAGSPVSVSVTMSDNVGVTLVALAQGDTPLALYTPLIPVRQGRLSFTATLPAGTYAFTATAYDRAQNVGVSAPLTVTVHARDAFSHRLWLPQVFLK